MTTEGTDPASGGPSARTVQDYIDETPVWADATAVRAPPMTNMQWLVWGLAAAGKFFEGMVVFMTGVALPLMAEEFGLGAIEKGTIAAASLFPGDYFAINVPPAAFETLGIPAVNLADLQTQVG